MFIKPLGAARIAELQRMLTIRARAFLRSPEIELDIGAIYAQFTEHWCAERSSPSDLFHCTDPLPACQEEWSGMDLPILVTRHDPRAPGAAPGTKPVVMIVGQDPLRNPAHFAKFKGTLIVGTPYAFHSCLYRQGRTRVYSRIVAPMLEHYDVYLTDVHKLGSTTNGGGKWRRDAMLDMEMLKYEFGIAPQKVILFGQLAQDAFAPIKKALGDAAPEFYSFPHPRARKESWAKALCTRPGMPFSATDDHKVAHILATAGFHGASEV